MSTHIEIKTVPISFITILLLLIYSSFFISPSFATDETNPQQDNPKKCLTRDHLSPHKEENSERAMVLLRNTDPKKVKVSDIKLGDYFIKIHNSIQKSKKKNYENLSKMIIYSYPLFTDEDTLFIFLLNHKEEFSSFIVVFLRQLALEALPNGLNAFRAAETSFNSLKDGLVDDPLFSCLLQNSIGHRFLDISTLPELIPTRSKKEWFERWGIDRLVYALTQRDISLYRAISFADLKANLTNQTNPPSSILAITNQFDRTIKWICFEILKRTQPRERTKMIQFFRMVGRMLYNSKNYYGAMQIVLAFNKVQVDRILSQKEMEENNIEDFIKTLTPLGNYKYYRELTNDISSKSNEILILPVFFKDILFAHETRSIEKIADLMNNFYKSQMFLQQASTFQEDEMDALKFVSQIPDIHESTLDEMSSLIKEWGIRREEDLPKNLEDWTSSHFYTFLQNHEEQSKIGNLFSKNIYSGKDLVSYLKSCSSIKEMDKKLNRLGFAQELRISLFGEIKKDPTDFIDQPVLKRAKTHSGVPNPKRKSIKVLETFQRELNTIP